MQLIIKVGTDCLALDFELTFNTHRFLISIVDSVAIYGVIVPSSGIFPMACSESGFSTYIY